MTFVYPVRGFDFYQCRSQFPSLYNQVDLKIFFDPQVRKFKLPALIGKTAMKLVDNERLKQLPVFKAPRNQIVINLSGQGPGNTRVKEIKFRSLFLLFSD